MIEWHFFRLHTEKRPPIWRIAANIMNKKPWASNKGLSSSLGVGQGANNSSQKLAELQHRCRCLGPGPILGFELCNGKGT
jgi:hypothetical protein